jgi:alkanesulfonate monooxygenase SsuD/methylene tetrahydromethanopterin reductase-like flavin-dependent oxidoreductase (luciferase family)
VRIGYLIDTNKGAYEQPMPSPADAAATMNRMIEEGIIAERSGFHSLQVPHRHGRTECYLPGPEQLLTILARETDRVAIGTFSFIDTLTHPMKAAEQFSVVRGVTGTSARSVQRGDRGLATGLRR